MSERTPVGRVRAAYRRIAEADRPEVWISLLPEEEALRRARTVESRLAAGEELPLPGLLVAVKDNIDAVGMPTTAAAPEYAYTPARSAPAVARLEAAGAVVIGKTNLDQFATGLVGTRSPYGAVRHAADPAKISGGSSSGSATAVALGIVDLALGTDTAGSGRVPAAFNGLIGVKPTLGLIPNTGVVPASRSYDTVSVFAGALETAAVAFAAMTGQDGADPRARSWPLDVCLAAPPRPRILVPGEKDLAAMGAGGREAFARAVDRFAAGGADIARVDLEPLLAAARLLYDGALVAERYQAVGSFLDTEPPGADPTVSAIIRAAAALPAWRFADDLRRLDEAKLHAARLFEGAHALLLPTAPGHPSLAEVAADPVGVNRWLGTYTNFVNLLDLAALAVPAGSAGGSPFGVTLVTRAFDDQLAFDLAARFLGEPAPIVVEEGVELAVFGAHLRGEPLNPQLGALGARFLGEVRTSDAYRLVLLDTDPPKPGLVEGAPGSGAPVPGELWRLPVAGLGRFLAELPWPMSLGPVVLADGRRVVGFSASAAAVDGAEDITDAGGWRAFRRGRLAEPPE